VSYDHTLGQVSRYGVQWAKRLFRYGQISMSLSRNEIVKHNQVIVTFRLLTGFADFSSRLISSGGYTSMSQVQRGSIRYDQEGHRVRFDRRYGIGSGSALVRPFLDDNYNGTLDEGEELIPGLRATIEGSRAKRSGRHQQYYYDNLQAYDQYLVQIDKYSLDDPWLKPTHENYEIFCVPNVVTAIDVPVVVSSEVSGRVQRRIDSLTAGQGGIRVMVLDLAKESVTEITTFSNGEYFYLGLIPGSYRAYIDREQLAKLRYSSQPEAIEFEVKPLEMGTSIEDIDFLIVPIQ
jgi:Arc/MetJ-type ribon-helix-helix transcriptional regulator